MSHANTRQRRPADLRFDDTRSPVTVREATVEGRACDDLVWPPETETLNAIEVVPLERQSTAAQPAAVSSERSERAPAMERPGVAPVRFEDLQNLDLETLFAPPDTGAHAAESSATSSRAAPASTKPVVAEPRSDALHEAAGEVRTPVDADILIRTSPVTNEPVRETSPADTMRPRIHIKWDESLDDDIPEVPLSGLAKGRELARARRTGAAPSRSSSDTTPPRPGAVHVAWDPTLHGDAPVGADRAQPRSMPDSRCKPTGAFRRAVRTTLVAGLLVAVAGAGWFTRGSWWEQAASRVFPPAPVAVPLVTDAPDESARLTPAAADSLRDHTRMTPPSDAVVVPPPQPVQVPDTRGAPIGAGDRPPVAPVATPEAATRSTPLVPPPTNAPAATDSLRDQAASRNRAAEDATTVQTGQPRVPDAATEEARASSRNVTVEAAPRIPAPAPARDVDAGPAPAAESIAPRPAVAVAKNREADVREALASYQTAYANLDAGAAQRVWPTVDQRALSRAFSTLRSQELRFDRCDVQVHEAAATASCEGVATFVPRVGRQEPQTEQRRWSFVLRQGPSGWRIERAETTR